MPAAELVVSNTILDNADGQLSRLSGRVTPLGRYLDSESDLVVDAALFAGLGYYTDSPLLALASFLAQGYEANIAEILTALGMPPDTPGTRETPRRFLQALHDATVGYEGDEKLLTAFPSEARGPSAPPGQIVEGPIAFNALCEHHALPFNGLAHVGDVPRGADHRHLEADQTRQPVRTALHRSGAARRAGRGHARAPGRRPRRGGAPRRLPPLF